MNSTNFATKKGVLFVYFKIGFIEYSIIGHKQYIKNIASKDHSKLISPLTLVGIRQKMRAN